MTLGAINYAALYFKSKTLTPIQGTPTHKSLKWLKAELQANTSSMEMDLGGVSLGYLYLVLQDADYAGCPTQLFVAPNFQQPLVNPNKVIQVQAFTLGHACQDEKRLYYKY